MGGLTGDGSIRMDGSPSTFLYRAARTVPGLLLCACIALPANELSKYHPSLDALSISLIIGIVLRNTLWGQALGLAFRRVWFIPFFIAVALLFSFYEPATALRSDIEPLATISLSLALASIGLTVDFDSIRTKGARPLLIGLFGWLAVSGLLLLMTIHFL